MTRTKWSFPVQLATKIKSTKIYLISQYCQLFKIKAVIQFKFNAPLIDFNIFYPISLSYFLNYINSLHNYLIYYLLMHQVTNFINKFSFSRKLAFTFFICALVTFIVIDAIMNVLYSTVVTSTNSDSIFDT